MTDTLGQHARRQVELAEAELEALKREMALGGVIIAGAEEADVSDAAKDDGPAADPAKVSEG